MDELFVSASDFRVHLKDLANDVAAGARRLVVLRHGHPMVAVVSQEDLAFLREKHPGRGAAAPKDSGIPEVLEHPERMPFEEVERLYSATKGSTEKRIQRWRERAYVIIKVRTGQYPDSPYAWG